MKKLPEIALICILAACSASMLSLTGCAALERSPNSAKLVTQYAVLKYAERMPAAERAARLERVRKIAADVSALAKGDSSLLALRAAVDAEIARTNLSPADRLLVNGLLDTLVAELTERFGSGLLSPEQLVEVSQVIGWIEEATRMAG